ncbi:hypothetical protein LJR220_000082 [Bradyrhizobium sp. LjRoot220]|uniref:type ISP restriction/modification enzyme n=1 Tax=Bradyrhizobium sp. LjRoot220 TaxID=3342284 RepID=UPI003ECE6FFB
MQSCLRSRCNRQRSDLALHCYSERFTDPSANRPKQAPRLQKRPHPHSVRGMIPSTPEPLPDSMDYDPTTQRLKISKGYVENVTIEMWRYEVSGKQILSQWFSYRRRDLYASNW